MLKLDFKNAVVRDSGFGLVVNGTSLAKIISTALGTRAGTHKAWYEGDLDEFNSNSCDITVTIDPQPVTTHIEDDNEVYYTVEELEEEKYNEFKKKNAEADPEE